MSGPKGYSYAVQEAALAEARERQSLRSALERIEVERAVLAAEIQEARRVYGDSVNSLQADTSTTRVDASLETLRSQVQARDDELGRERTRFKSQLTSAAREVLVVGVEVSAGTDVVSAESALAARGSVTADAPPQDVEREVTRLLERLSPDQYTDLAAVNRALGTARSAQGARVELALDALRVAISRVNLDVAERAEADEALRDLLSRLDGFEDELVAQTRERLRAVALRGLTLAETDALTRDVEKTIALARSQEERRYVARELAGTLQGLGYTVSEGFQTALVVDGFVDVTRSDLDGYAVRVRTSQARQSINFNVVRGPAWRVDQAAHDAEVERTWCSDVPRIEASLDSVGVQISQTAHAEAGAVQMQEVAMPTPKTQTSTSSHTREDTA